MVVNYKLMDTNLIKAEHYYTFADYFFNLVECNYIIAEYNFNFVELSF